MEITPFEMIGYYLLFAIPMIAMMLDFIYIRCGKYVYGVNIPTTAKVICQSTTFIGYMMLFMYFISVVFSHTDIGTSFAKEVAIYSAVFITLPFAVLQVTENIPFSKNRFKYESFLWMRITGIIRAIFHIMGFIGGIIFVNVFISLIANTLGFVWDSIVNLF